MSLDVVPKGSLTFALADGTQISRGFRAPFEPPQGDGHTPLIFGEAGDESFSDAVSLEILGLVLHPFKRCA
jgi:hypothetical protein